jgi:hypothetical protein
VKELIEKIAQATVKYGMETAAVFFLEQIRPISRIAWGTSMITVSPWITIVSSILNKDEWEQRGMSVLYFFRDRNNVEQLIRRIEELAQDVREKERIAKEAEKEKKKEKDGFLSRLGSRFKN